jgi:hypothetical protein
MKTFSPFCRFAFSTRACHAVRPTRGGKRLLSMSSPGLEGERRLLDRDDFGERADAEIIRPRIDLVARLEQPHPRSGLDHDAGARRAQDEGRR